MPRLTIRNLTNSPFDLENGLHLPAMGEVTEEFTNEYAALLQASPGVEAVSAPVADGSPSKPVRKGKR